MYFILCAPPSAGAALTLRLTTTLLQEHHPEARLVYANDGPSLAKSLAEGERKPSLLYFDFPDATVATAMGRRPFPKILVWEPVEQTVAHCMAAWGQDLATAIRFVSRSCSLLHAYAKLPSVAVVTPRDPGMTVDSLVSTIAGYFGIPLTDGQRGSILERNGLRTGTDVETAILVGVEHAAKARDIHAKMSDAERQMLHIVANGYDVIGPGGLPSMIRWPGDIFLRAGGEGASAFDPVDLTGPARILSFGPYLHLPVGEWLVELRFHVTDNESGNSILIEVTSGSDVLASAYGSLPADGTFAMRVPFSVPSAQMAVEIRCVLATGAIEGIFRLLDVIVEPVAS